MEADEYRVKGNITLLAYWLVTKEESDINR